MKIFCIFPSEIRLDAGFARSLGPYLPLGQHVFACNISSLRLKFIFKDMMAEPKIAIVNIALCGQCGGCVPVCVTDALYLSPAYLRINSELCSGCGDCVMTCPVGALRLGDE